MTKRYQHDALGEFKSGLEAIASIASNAVLEPLSGYAGLYALARGRPLSEAVSSLEDIQSKAYVPDDPRVLQGLGQVMQPVAEGLEDLKSGLGEGTLELTGSPTLATIAHNSPELVAAALGLRQLTKGPDPQRISPKFNHPEAGPDLSRRDFVRKAGIAAAATPLAAKGLLDVGTAGEAVGTAAKKAAPAAARHIAYLSPKQFTLTSMLRHIPGLKDAVKKGNFEEFDGALYVHNDSPHMKDKDYITNFEDVEIDELQEALRLVEKDQDLMLDMDSLDPENYPFAHTLREMGTSDEHADIFKEILFDSSYQERRPLSDIDWSTDDVFIWKDAGSGKAQNLMRAIFMGIRDAAGDFRVPPDQIKPAMKAFMDENPDYPDIDVIKQLYDDPDMLEKVFANAAEEMNMYDGTVPNLWEGL